MRGVVRGFLVASGWRLAIVLPAVGVIVLLTPSDLVSKAIGLVFSVVAVAMATGLQWLVEARREKRRSVETGQRVAGDEGDDLPVQQLAPSLSKRPRRVNSGASRSYPLGGPACMG
jgi:hypothetical protein